MITEELNCLSIALRVWSFNKSFGIFYNGDHVIADEGIVNGCRVTEIAWAGYEESFIPIEEFGLEHVLSSFGTEITPTDKKILKRYFKKHGVREFEYPGYMSQEAQEFFQGNTITEPRDGCAVVGTFVKLSSGDVCLPKKGDRFIKNENNGLTIKP